MGYTLQKYGYGGGDEILRLYIYPNIAEHSSDSGVNTLGDIAIEAAVAIGKQLTDVDAIYKYEVYESNEYPNLTEKKHPEDMLSDWKTNDINNKNLRYGSHQLVYEYTDGKERGYAEGAGGTFGAWNTSMDCIVKSSAPTAKAKTLNLMVHEHVHNLVNDSLAYVQWLAEDDGDGHVEHELGMIYKGWFGDGPSTPMARGYESSQAREGNCNSNVIWNGSFDRNMTDCTIAAMEATANES